MTTDSETELLSLASSALVGPPDRYLVQLDGSTALTACRGHHDKAVTKSVGGPGRTQVFSHATD